uniref:hypothetical protein n=1 Tax=Herbidospora sakaeratensis TaxID=564415 RepID=UPI0014721693|nr:hypothetical protein [Herbidospora sakaeratensis]
MCVIAATRDPSGEKAIARRSPTPGSSAGVRQGDRAQDAALAGVDQDDFGACAVHREHASVGREHHGRHLPPCSGARNSGETHGSRKSAIISPVRVPIRRNSDWSIKPLHHRDEPAVDRPDRQTRAVGAGRRLHAGIRR